MPSFEIEKQYPGKVICGIDEVGLGPLAGPIVVCSCVILDYNLPMELLNNIDDSKKLTEKKRETIFEIVTNYKKIKYGIAIIDVEIIDNIGLSNAWKKGVIDSQKDINQIPDVCLIDGIRKVDIENVQVITVVKGDQKSYSIATASIIAKVTRDRLMRKIHLEFPEYGFDKNVGYGTKFHLEALRKFGPCKYHRKSYAPVASIIGKRPIRYIHTF
ncbi:MAG: ribonuclease HII [Holosporales bacterium]|jgi:ribonuclease HII|nr:ribonuclease HII [Holosporales bacterium]